MDSTAQLVVIFTTTAVILGCSLCGVNIPIPSFLIPKKGNEDDPSNSKIEKKDQMPIEKNKDEKISEYSKIIEEALESLRNLLINYQPENQSQDISTPIHTISKPIKLRSKSIKKLLKLNEYLSKKKLQINDIIRAARGNSSAMHPGSETDFVYSDNYHVSSSDSEDSDSSFYDATGSNLKIHSLKKISIQPKIKEIIIPSFRLTDSNAEQYNHALSELVRANDKNLIYCSYANKYNNREISELTDNKIFSQLTNGNDLDYLIKLDILADCAQYSISNGQLMKEILEFLRQYLIYILQIENSETDTFIKSFDDVISYYDNPENSNDINEALKSLHLTTFEVFSQFLRVYPYSYSDLMSILPYSLQKVKSMCAYSPLYVVFKSMSTTLSLALNQYTADINPDSFYGKLVTLIKEIATYIVYGFINEYSASHRAFLMLYTELKFFIEDIFESDDMDYSTIETLSASFVDKARYHLTIVLQCAKDLAPK